MEQSKGNAVVREIARPQHEGHVIAVLEVHGREAWLASQVNEALGYERADQVVTAISRDMTGEVEEGTDYAVLRGEELALVKQAIPDLVDARAPAVMVLFESGVHLVAMRARTEKARSFRRWLAEEVLPSIRRTGGYGRAPGLTAADLAQVVAVTVEQVLARLAPHQLDEDGLDLDRASSDVQRAREMRHLSNRYHRTGRRLMAQRLEARAAALLLGDVSSDPSDDMALRALRHVMEVAQLHREARFFTLGAPPSPVAGSWWGRWDEEGPYIAFRATWLTAVLQSGGFSADAVRRDWSARGWLDSGNDKGMARNVRIGEASVRCIALPVDVLEHLGVL